MIERQFIVNLKGRDYPLWAGILDAATKAGLRSLRTTVLQVPAAENGHLAVVMARAEFEDGRVFEDVGDCSPASTSPQLAAAALRLASTRAKGRCLRDAVNVGQTMLEELPDLDRIEEPAPPVRPVNGNGAHADNCEGCRIPLTSAQQVYCAHQGDQRLLCPSCRRSLPPTLS